MKKTLIAALIFLAVNPYLKGKDNDEAVFTVKYIKTTKKAKSMQSAADTARQVMDYILILGDGYFHVEEKDGQRLYDFDKHRITFVNKKDKTFFYVPSVHSLHYRTAEFKNRMMQMDAFNSAGVSNNPYTLFELEALFGIKSGKGGAGDITREIRNGSLVYSRVKKAEFTMKPSAHKIDGRHRKAWRMFFTYEENIHPDLRDMIMKEDSFPSEYRYSYVNAPAASYEVHCSVEKISNRKKEDDSLKSYRFAVPYDDDLSKILNRVHSLDIEKSKVSHDALKTFVRESMDRKEYLDALLGITEYILQEGQPPADLIEPLRPYFQGDAKLSTYLRATQEKDYQKANAVIESIDRKGMKKAHIMDITRGVNYLLLDDPSAARGLFLEVLKISPCITGVYYDLGKTYIPRYDMMSAWLCWDTVRFLNPVHPFSREIDRIESSYADEFPDFF